MSSNTVLIIIVAFLAGLLVLSWGLIFYLVKRSLDEKPVAIKETVAPGEPPQVVTRADLVEARKFQEEQNFRQRDATKYQNLDEMPAEAGMAALEDFLNRGEE